MHRTSEARAASADSRVSVIVSLCTPSPPISSCKQLETVRAERDSLRNERATLEDKLADVEKFQSSERGRALDRMEQELASEKMARVELEADRDDLQSQLAAVLQATART